MPSSFRIFNYRLSFKYSSALYLSKWSLVILNVIFIVTDIITSSIIWVNLFDDYQPFMNQTSLHIDTDDDLEELLSTKKFGIILIGILITTVSTIGIFGAVRKNIKTLMIYDAFVGFVLILLLFGWRNYQNIFYWWITVIVSILTALSLSFIYIKTIRNEPMRIRKQLLLNHVNNRETARIDSKRLALPLSNCPC
ncbi:hypothetical protein DERF_012000, partial [Dermatophagoides farinae]